MKDLEPEQKKLISRYLDLLVEGNKRVRLTGLREIAEMRSKLIDPCISLAQALKPKGSFLDIGTGGGFPGIVVKILHPSWRGVLLDRSFKKGAFVQQVLEDLGLNDKTQVVTGQFQEYVHENERAFNTIFSRGVALDRRLLRSILKQLTPGGQYYFFGQKNVPVVEAMSKELDCLLAPSVAGWWRVELMFHVKH